jgi:hypothetical protein
VAQAVTRLGTVAFTPSAPFSPIHERPNHLPQQLFLLPLHARHLDVGCVDLSGHDRGLFGLHRRQAGRYHRRALCRALGRTFVQIKALKPLMWLVQRTISTPTTHFAHHAMYNNDGIGNYKGNFGNLMFLWDVLFGTAHITQQYPAQVGLREDELFGKEKWWIDLLYPVFWSKREQHRIQTRWQNL